MQRTVTIAAMTTIACSHGQEAESSAQADVPGDNAPDSPNSDTKREPPIAADVLAVRVSGTPGTYTFAVTLRSPDSGCEQYADWWEVLTPAGAIVYRRALMHSHLHEQPFTRSGGPVDVVDTAEVLVRAHEQRWLWRRRVCRIGRLEVCRRSVRHRRTGA